MDLQVGAGKAIVGLRPSFFGAGIRISCTGHHQYPRARLSLRKSPMKLANASKLDRKSGVRWGEPGAPVDSSAGGYDTDSFAMECRGSLSG
jgi:hypothetical protein